MQGRKMETAALYCSSYSETPLASYTKLMEACTVLNPTRRPFVTLRTVNQAGRTRWEREMEETKEALGHYLKTHHMG